MSNFLKHCFLLCIGLVLTVTSFAQTRNITGKVTATDGSPIANVTVSVKGSEVATVTNERGEYAINASNQSTLVFTMVGAQPKEIRVGGNNSIDVSLSRSDMQLDEVVVVGYGTQRKANLTGAVTTVKLAETIGSRPVTDLGNGLQGAVSGLSITNPSGDIGGNPVIRLRGLSGSLNSSGAKPLILVDNVEMPDLRLLNPDDIESMSVLKDAASTSIYGTRAAFGVILITTKKGRKGADKYSINYKNNFAWSTATVVPTIADAADGAEMAFKAMQRTNPNTTQFGVVGMYFDEIAVQKIREWKELYGGMELGPEMVKGRDFEIRNNRLFFYRPWDVEDLYIKKWTPQQTHNLTLSGSSERTAYNLGFGFLDQKGVIKLSDDKFQRFNVDLGVTSSITNWLDARAKVSLANAATDKPYYFSSYVYDPWYYLYRWQQVYPYGTYEGKPFRSAATEIEQAKMNHNENKYNRFSVGGTFKLAKGLTVDADYTFANTNEREQRTGGSVTGYNFWAGGDTTMSYSTYTSPTYDRAQLYYNYDNRNVFKAYATYNKPVEDHNFKLMVGTDIEEFRWGSQYSERRKLLDPNIGLPNLATGDQFTGSSKDSWSTMGYFGRLNYSFKNKYLLELNGRYDGSSKFPVNDKWGFFPSVSAGWVVSKEGFMSGTENVLNNWKLRASWGEIGNQDVGLYRYLSTMGSSLSGWLIGNENVTTVGTPGLVSPTLTWETVTSLNLGTDLTLFKSLNMSFDWFTRTTSDMLSSGITVPNTLGTGAPQVNFGELESKGWEAEANYSKSIGKDFNFHVGVNVSDFVEKITNFANSTQNIYSNRTGRVLGEIWGYETDRLFQQGDFTTDPSGNLVLNKDIPTQSLFEASWFKYGPGDVKYRDLNGDGKIDYGTNTVDDHGDLKLIGNSTPRYQYGVRLGVEFKGFDVNAFVQGVGSKQAWPNGPIFIPGYRPGEAWYQHQLDYWTPENPNAFYPRPTDHAQSNNMRNYLRQDRYLLNMAYTRLKNLNLGFTFPTALVEKAKLQTARIYFSGENLWTKDHLNGVALDPEVDYTPDGLGDPNTFGRGYPFRKILSFGVQVTL